MLKFLGVIDKEIYMKELLKKCLVEFVGTFFLVLTIGCSLFPNGDVSFPPMAIGFILMVMVYAGGHISGGHYNPAVSFAAAIRGALDWKDFIPYIISQFLAAALAAWVVSYLVAIPPFASEASFSVIPMAVCEFLFTFALCYVVLNTATSDDTKGNSYYGLAIGATVLVGLIGTAGICYGAFNPAVALGIYTMGITKVKLIVITLLTNFVGGAAAAGVYKVSTNK